MAIRKFSNFNFNGSKTSIAQEKNVGKIFVEYLIVGGGGGGSYNGTQGTGGTGGGTNGNGFNASANTGGGGGGDGTNSGIGKNGGSGVVIIKSPQVAASYTGSPTTSTVGSSYVYVFNGDGSITF